jgi:DNA polymerase IV
MSGIHSMHLDLNEERVMKPELKQTIANDCTVNKSLPYTMHIDLNSCFAIIEQQANRLLRGRPVGIAAYDTPRGFVLAASYEAKAKGIKLGVNVEQSRSLAPGIVIMAPDPAKYREAHKLFKTVLLEYSPNVTPKSIDEFVLDLEHSPILKSAKSEIKNSNQIQNAELEARNMKHEKRKMSDEYERNLHNQAMLKIGYEIKDKIRQRLGEWVTVNIGISTNRFLAKYAAGFDKPDGMTLIDHTNLRKYYSCGKKHDCAKDKKNCKTMHLMDLPGINVRFRSRLRQAGIYDPTEFLEADMHVLKKQVFKSINGYHWYMRLRGYEADAVEFNRKSIGHQHALSDKTSDIDKLEKLLMKLCEKTGRRLRKNNLYATGIHLYLGFVTPYYTDPAGFENMRQLRSWHHGEKVHHRLYSTQEIYEVAKKLLYQADIAGKVRILAVNVFGLEPWEPVQLNLFEVQKLNKTPITTQGNSSYSNRIEVRDLDSRKRISDTVDTINNRYGEFVITPAMMLDMQGTILDRIAFGQVKDLE